MLARKTIAGGVRLNLPVFFPIVKYSQGSLVPSCFHKLKVSIFTGLNPTL